MRNSLLTAIFAAICCSACAAETTTTSLSVPSADKKTAITLQLSAGWKTYRSKDGTVSIDVPKCANIQVWALGNASVDEAAKQVSDLIKGQVTHFKVTASTAITVAGTPGKRLTGTGEEADDGDPSSADVYLFSVEGKVFIICAHGEGDSSVKSRAILTAMLASVKKS